MQRESYVPRTWRSHPLHLCPAEPFSWEDSSTHACLNWIFLISSLNFSFWSELEGQPGRYGVEWREGWDSDRTVVHTGYWSLVAAIDRGELTKYLSASRASSQLLVEQQHGGRVFCFTLLSSSSHPCCLLVHRCFVLPPPSTLVADCRFCSSRGRRPNHGSRILRLRGALPRRARRTRLPFSSAINGGDPVVT